MSRLDEILPDFEFNEIHRLKIHAAGGAAYAAVKQTRLSDLSPLASWMLALRSLPDRLLRPGRATFAADLPLLEAMTRAAFVKLDEVPGTEIVIGTIGQPWKIVGGADVRIRDCGEFLRFIEPDYARIVTNLRVEAIEPSGWLMCSTETRVHIPDPAARRRFRLYWAIISMGSAWIRLMWLRAIKRRAEAAS